MSDIGEQLSDSKESILFDRLRSVTDLGLACHFPTLVSELPAHSSRLPSTRRYLELMLAELHLLCHKLGQRRSLSYLLWLGDCAGWLDNAEMTELMFRINQRFQASAPHLKAATIELQGAHQSTELLALCRGLGFTHLLTSHQPDTAKNQPVSDLGFQRANNLEDAPGTRPMDTTLVSLGMGGKWQISGQLYGITNQIVSYSTALQANRIPWAEACLPG